MIQQSIELQWNHRTSKKAREYLRYDKDPLSKVKSVMSHELLDKSRES